jgi:hypothetical protein
MATPKPGYKTTEFWLTAAATLITTLSITGVIGPNDSGTLITLVKDVVAGGVALFGLIAYVAGRVKLKSEGGGQ